MTNNKLDILKKLKFLIQNLIIINVQNYCILFNCTFSSISTVTVAAAALILSIRISTVSGTVWCVSPYICPHPLELSQETLLATPLDHLFLSNGLDNFYLAMFSQEAQNGV
jgi:hypothetical protein